MTTYYDQYGQPAELWLWQSGDRWMACPASEQETWWEGAAEEDIKARPYGWAHPVNQSHPLRGGDRDWPMTGTAVYWDVDGEPHTVTLPTQHPDWKAST